MRSALLLAALAARAERPPDEVLDDLRRYERGMDRLLMGPPGCWDFEAQMSLKLTIHQPPDLFSTARDKTYTFEGPFAGRLENGVWVRTKNDLKLVGDERLDVDLPAFPLMGKVRDDQEGEPDLRISVSKDSTAISGSVGQSLNLLQHAIDRWAGTTETAMTRWDAEQDAVVLLREIPVSEDDDRLIEVSIRFPAGALGSDEALADRIDAVWPRTVRLGEWPLKVTVRDAQAHLVGFLVEGKVLPRLESISLVAGFVGYTGGVEQSMRYTAATPCTAPTAPPAATPQEE